MTTSFPRTLMLTLAVAAVLSACNRSADEPSVTPAATAPPTSASREATAPSFDTSELDTSIRACQDFNDFVNAKWVKANPIPEDRSGWGAFDALADRSLDVQHGIVEAAAKNIGQSADGSTEKKIGLLFQSGMDEAAVEKAGFDPIKPQLDAIAALKGGSEVAGYITRRYAQGDAQVFGFGAGADFKHADQQIAYANEGGLGLPTKDYYSDPKYAEQRAAYAAYIAKSFELTGTAAADAKQQADQVLALETSLAKASLSPVEGRTPDNQYHFVSVTEADRITPHFDWSACLTAQGVTVDGFSLSQPKFFAEFDKLLATAPIGQWQAYLRFHTIDGAAPALSKAFVDNSFEFNDKTMAGQPQQKPRWKRVLSMVNGSMGQALGHLYVDQEFTPEAKVRAGELVDNVRNALKARIENLDWMSDATKQKAIAKWNTFLPKIGYPETWRDWSGLDIKSGSLYANLEAASKFNYAYDIAKIGKPTDRKEWGMTPQTVNAYYNPTDNTINFPAAILQPPFFDAKADDAINYGGIGAVIGHEASHGFDDEGSQFDGAGNNVDWWTAADKTAFEARTRKLVDQFNAYTPLASKPDLHVNGQLTLGENIADLGGLNVAYDALQTALKQHPDEAGKQIDGYTPDQRFFLNWARVWRGSTRDKRLELLLNSDPHAPIALRAMAAPSNMPAFAKAFSCKAGDPMVRGDGKQVVIW